jgi:hypothetical protein
VTVPLDAISASEYASHLCVDARRPGLVTDGPDNAALRSSPIPRLQCLYLIQSTLSVVDRSRADSMSQDDCKRLPSSL